MKRTREEVARANQMLRKLIHEGATLYFVLRSHSRDTLSRTQDVYVCDDCRMVWLSGYIAAAMGYSQNAEGALRMDEDGSELTNALSRKLFGDGQLLSRERL